MVKYITSFILLLTFYGLTRLDILRTTKVIDGDSGYPVHDALITYSYFNMGDYCGQPLTRRTNKNGVALSPPKMGVCGITVVADGYHKNGYSYITKIPQNIKLYTQRSDDSPVLFRAALNEGEQINILDSLHVHEYTTADKLKTGQSFDFGVLKITNDTGDEMQGPQAKIRFYGKGGLQKISNDRPVSNSLQPFFDLENLRVAPQEGYVNEMNIVSGKSYVARLRDGSHYIKFYSFILKKNDVTPYVEFYIYANRDSSTGLDFLNIPQAMFYRLN